MMLNALCLDNWTITAIDEISEATRVVSARYDIQPDSCPKCGVIGRLYRHGAKDIRYVDAPAYCKQTVIMASVARFRCRDCNGTSMQPLPDIDGSHRMTVRCVRHIEKLGVPDTYADIAREIGVDEKTIANICNSKFERMMAERQIEAPEVLGIDELTLLGRKRTIFVDVTGRKVIDLIDAMNKRYVDRWLSNLPHKIRVRAVTTDMWGPYHASIREYIPHAAIIVDKFHVLKKVNEALDRVRNRNRREKGIKSNPHKARRLLQESRHNLTPARAAQVEAFLAKNPLVRLAYDAKESFYDIYRQAGRVQAEKAFERWRTEMPADIRLEYEPIAKMVGNWHPEIFAYFDYRLTNAYTESKNGLIKKLNRAGNGYSFDTIRAKAILSETIGEIGQCSCCRNLFQRRRLKKAPSEIEGRKTVDGALLCRECSGYFHTLDTSGLGALLLANTTLFS